MSSRGSVDGACLRPRRHRFCVTGPLVIGLLALSPGFASAESVKKFALTVEERRIDADEGFHYDAWTFNGKVPGPVLRVREGETVEITLINKGTISHGLDTHAARISPGRAFRTVDPGGSHTFGFRAETPGVYLYHCSAGPILNHIANGMYGAMIVEPRKGLPLAREFVVVQSEFYTEGEVGDKGFQAFSSKKGAAEKPEYVVFNGKVGALMPDGGAPLKAKVGETVRIYFGNIGPNLVSSFHVIGEIFDRVYREGEVPPGVPDTNVQTTLVPAGSASIAEFKAEVPGAYILVDHSIFRLDRGAVGVLAVEGAEAPEIYKKVK